MGSKWKNWRFENDTLFVGDENEGKIGDIYYNTSVQVFNPVHLGLKPYIDENSTEEQIQKIKKSIFDLLSKSLNYKLKTSKCNRFAAVFSNNHLHCDFFEQHEHPHPKYPGEVLGKHIFTLKRNTYKSQYFLLEFFVHPESKEVLFIFNTHHGGIEVRNMKNEIVSKDYYTDRFFKSLKIINNKFFLLHSIASFIEIVQLYDIDNLLTEKNYKPENIFMENDMDLYPIAFNGNIKVNGVEYSVENYIKYHDFIEDSIPKFIKENNAIIVPGNNKNITDENKKKTSKEYSIEYFSNNLEKVKDYYYQNSE